MNTNAQALGSIKTKKKSASSKRNLELARKVKAQKKKSVNSENVAITDADLRIVQFD